MLQHGLVHLDQMKGSHLHPQLDLHPAGAFGTYCKEQELRGRELMLLEFLRRKVRKSWRATANIMNWQRGALNFLLFSAQILLVKKGISAVPVRC